MASKREAQQSPGRTTPGLGDSVAGAAAEEKDALQMCETSSANIRNIGVSGKRISHYMPRAGVPARHTTSMSARKRKAQLTPRTFGIETRTFWRMLQTALAFFSYQSGTAGVSYRKRQAMAMKSFARSHLIRTRRVIMGVPLGGTALRTWHKQATILRFSARTLALSGGGSLDACFSSR